MQILDALRLYANYLLDTPGTGVTLTGSPFPLASDSGKGGAQDIKTVKKILGMSAGKVSESAILLLCRLIAFNVPYVQSHYQKLFDESYLPDNKPAKQDLISKSEYSQIAVDAIIRIATQLKQQLQHKDNLPFARNRLFTGRETLLRNLHDNLQTRHYATLTSTSLKGLGGVGKTQLALEYAWRYYQHYQQIFWVSADGESTFKEEMASLSKLLMLPEQKLMQDRVASVLNWFKHNDGWLLIIDNAENRDDIDMVAKYFNFATSGAMIITTRTQAQGKFSVPFPVDVFDELEGGEFLEKRTGRTGEITEPHEDAKAISKRLGGLALALDQAGAYIQQRDISFADYLRLYNSNAPALLKQPVDQDYPNSTYRTFSISFEKIKAKNSIAADLLTEFSMHTPDGIPVLDLFTEYSELELLDAIAVLRDYSLVKWHDDRKMVSIHRVVQDIIKDVVLS